MILDVFKLDGRVALVTGGSQGLGLVMAKALAEAGADVAIVSRQEEKARKGAEAIAEATGRHTLGVVADVTDAQQVETMVQAVIKQFGRLDILINCAGINIRKPIEEFDEESWERVQAINLKAPYLCARAVVPLMKAQQYGRVINVASMLGLTSLPGRGAYSSSKGGLISLTQALALELASHNITVNALCPGPCITEMNIPVLSDPETNTFFTSRIPLGRWGEADEMGGPAVFLASAASSFMTGATLVVDGGWTAQ